MHRIILLPLLLFLTIPKSNCQSNKDIYEVLTALVDTLTSNFMKDFRGYSKWHNIKPEPIVDSTITLFDPETFEELTYSKEVYNSKILPLQLKKYHKELQKMELIHKIKFPVVFVSSFGEKHLNLLKNKSLDFSNVDSVILKAVPSIKPLNIQMKKIKPKKKLIFKRPSEKNIEKYKFANIGIMQVSKPIFNEAKTETLVFLGIYYYDNGASWNEGFAHLKKINNKWIWFKLR